MGLGRGVERLWLLWHNDTYIYSGGLEVYLTKSQGNQEEKITMKNICGYIGIAVYVVRVIDLSFYSSSKTERLLSFSVC